MSCKYCFQTDHTIETCKSIFCKSCKEIGHPYWLCKNGKNKRNEKSNIRPSTSNSSLKSKKDTVSTSTTPTTPTVPKNIVNETRRDLQFYLKQSQRKWSDIL